MAIGGGHTHYTRYGSGFGANPLSILAPSTEKTTGAMATGATLVKLTRVGDEGKMIQFSTQMRESRAFAHR
jgi:molybdopterin-containing oxidoreductase family iron-sulfur binding subunit